MATFNIHKRKDTGKWQYDVRDPSLPNGKKRKTFKTKAEAQHAAQELVNKINSGLSIDNKMTFKSYYIEWLKVNDKASLSEQQYDWYKRALKVFVEYLGADKPLHSVTRQEMQKLLNEYGKGKTTASVKKLKSCLVPCLKDATYDGYIAKDPTYNLKIKGTVAGMKEEDKYLTIQQYLDLIEYFKSKSEKSYILLYVIAVTGARFSEVNNITWDDINYKMDAVFLPGTKTDTAPRQNELPIKTIQYIKETLSAYPRRFDGYVFKLTNNAARHAMQRAQKAVGIPEDDRVNIYGLRHTHCSYLISQGIDIEYISKRLGHKNIHTTLSTYSHLLDEHRKTQSDKLRAIFKNI